MATVRERMQAELKAAMAARERTTVAVLRTTLAALSNAEAVTDVGSRPAVGAFANEVARRHLDDDAVRDVIAAERAELQAAGDEYRALGQSTEADELDARLAVLARYL
ncbi:MAG TPA: hypothetical protein VM143_05790 [Acidimicrobiales bacterium]|nr:hypothetical protein [Acidimicrobiales bacterium]